jgi:pyrroloquinoline quinone (PQQ) biosynthesis protein C
MGGVLTTIIIMKIKLPTIVIETEEYKATIKALMNYYGFSRDEAKRYLIDDLTARAERHCEHLLEELTGYVEYE